MEGMIIRRPYLFSGEPIDQVWCLSSYGSRTPRRFFLPLKQRESNAARGSRGTSRHIQWCRWSNWGAGLGRKSPLATSVRGHPSNSTNAVLKQATTDSYERTLTGGFNTRDFSLFVHPDRSFCFQPKHSIIPHIPSLGTQCSSVQTPILFVHFTLSLSNLSGRLLPMNALQPNLNEKDWDVPAV